MESKDFTRVEPRYCIHCKRDTEHAVTYKQLYIRGDLVKETAYKIRCLEPDCPIPGKQSRLMR